MRKWSITQYLNDERITRKVLVIGCGRTPHQALTSTEIPGIACSLARSHRADFTIDVSPNAGADMTMDLVTYRGTELGIRGRHRFDAVEFEYISRGPRHRFTVEHVNGWILAADDLLKLDGHLVFYSGDTYYLEWAKLKMIQLGYSVQDNAMEGDGSDGNRYGHRSCTGRKRTMNVRQITGWLWK